MRLCCAPLRSFAHPRAHLHSAPTLSTAKGQRSRRQQRLAYLIRGNRKEKPVAPGPDGGRAAVEKCRCRGRAVRPVLGRSWSPVSLGHSPGSLSPRIKETKGTGQVPRSWPRALNQLRGFFLCPKTQNAPKQGQSPVWRVSRRMDSGSSPQGSTSRYALPTAETETRYELLIL